MVGKTVWLHAVSWMCASIARFTITYVDKLSKETTGVCVCWSSQHWLIKQVVYVHRIDSEAASACFETSLGWEGGT
jgi:hypothetical protein